MTAFSFFPDSYLSESIKIISSCDAIAPLLLGKEVSNRRQDLCIGFGGVIKPRSVDECYTSTIKFERFGNLYNIGAGLEPCSNTQIRATRDIDKLNVSQGSESRYRPQTNINQPTSFHFQWDP